MGCFEFNQAARTARARAALAPRAPRSARARTRLLDRRIGDVDAAPRRQKHHARDVALGKLDVLGILNFERSAENGAESTLVNRSSCMGGQLHALEVTRPFLKPFSAPRRRAVENARRRTRRFVMIASLPGRCLKEHFFVLNLVQTSNRHWKQRRVFRRILIRIAVPRRRSGVGRRCRRGDRRLRRRRRRRFRGICGRRRRRRQLDREVCQAVKEGCSICTIVALAVILRIAA